MLLNDFFFAYTLIKYNVRVLKTEMYFTLNSCHRIDTLNKILPDKHLQRQGGKLEQ